MNEILFPIFLVVAICIIVPIILFKNGDISTKDCQIFLKTKRYPKWEYLGERRMVVKEEIGDYYKLTEQALYMNMNLNDEERKPEWRTNYRPAIGSIGGPCGYVIKKVVKKDYVTIDKEGVARYVNAKDPIEI